jgi:hypothetical protein
MSEKKRSYLVSWTAAIGAPMAVGAWALWKGEAATFEALIVCAIFYVAGMNLGQALLGPLIDQSQAGWARALDLIDRVTEDKP